MIKTLNSSRSLCRQIGFWQLVFCTIRGGFWLFFEAREIPDWQLACGTRIGSRLGSFRMARLAEIGCSSAAGR